MSRLASLVCRSARYLLPTLALAATSSAQAPTVISNEMVDLHFDTDDPVHGFVFTAIGDAVDSTAYSFLRRPLWEITFSDPATPGTTITALPDRTLGFEFDLAVSVDPGGDGEKAQVMATWDEFTHPLLFPDEEFKVRVTATIGNNEQVAELEIELGSEEGCGLATDEVSFPRLDVVAGISPATEVLAVPYWAGELFYAPALNPDLVVASLFGEPLVHPGSLNMQWLAYYDAADPEEAMLFWATRDEEGFPKGFRVDPDPFAFPLCVGLGIDVVPPGGTVPGTKYESSFPSTVGVLRGDWYDAARYYRESWALETFGSEGPLDENPDYSATVRDADVFGILDMNFCLTSSPFCPALQDDPANFAFAGQQIQELETFLDAQMLHHVYRWDTNSFTARNGDWWPIRPEFMQEFVPDVLAQGFDWVPYFNPTAYSNQAATYAAPYVPGFETRNVQEFTRVLRSGSIDGGLSQFCDKLTPCDPTLLPQLQEVQTLCQATPFAREYVRYAVDQFDALGAAAPGGLYLDVFHADSLNCFSAAHEAEGFHPVGGGSYWTQAKVDLAHEIKEHMREDKGVEEFFLYSEAPIENLIGTIEFSYGHHGGFGTADGVRGVAPLFQTVYHDYMRVGSILGIDVPQTVPFIFDPYIWFSSRQIFAANIFFGQTPYSTSRAWLLTLNSRLNPLFFPDLYRHLLMVKEYVGLLEHDDVRDYTVFGQRLRTPETDAGEAFMGFLFITELLPFSTTQDVVYATVLGEPGPEGEIGLLLLNWTDPADPLISQFGPPLFSPGTTPGDQTIEVTFQRDDYELADCAYDVFEIVAGVEEPVPLGVTLDFTTSDSASLTVEVPSRSARFFFLEEGDDD